MPPYGSRRTPLRDTTSRIDGANVVRRFGAGFVGRRVSRCFASGRREHRADADLHRWFGKGSEHHPATAVQRKTRYSSSS